MASTELWRKIASAAERGNTNFNISNTIVSTTSHYVEDVVGAILEQIPEQVKVKQICCYWYERREGLRDWPVKTLEQLINHLVQV
jgi:hypothetical protein